MRKMMIDHDILGFQTNPRCRVHLYFCLLLLMSNEPLRKHGTDEGHTEWCKNLGWHSTLFLGRLPFKQFLKRSLAWFGESMEVFLLGLSWSTRCQIIDDYNEKRQNQCLSTASWSKGYIVQMQRDLSQLRLHWSSGCLRKSNYARQADGYGIDRRCQAHCLWLPIF